MTCNIKTYLDKINEETTIDFKKYDEEIKTIFYNDFVHNKVYRNNRRISAGSTKEEIEECYNHLTTEGSMDNSIRLPDLRRYERIKILKDLLTSENCNSCENCYVWEKKEKYLKEKIFCPNSSYLIILLKRDYIYKFVSAYFIRSKKKKERLIKEYNENKKRRDRT